MLIASATLLLCMTTSAQTRDYPKVEFFNSYSNAVDGDGDEHGWLTSLTYYRDAHFGIVGEFSRHYRTKVVVTPEGEIKDAKGFKVALLGVQLYTFRRKPVAPFFRLMFGGSDENKLVVEGGKIVFKPRSTLRVAVGGGLDVKINARVALRALQVDIMKVNDNTLNRVRVSTGLVLRF